MQFINVMTERNVYADGIHDDTKALQACIDEIKEGGTIYFPDGIYLVSAALIFYSHQHFILSDRAIIRRSDTSDPLTRYLLASYSEPDWGGYEGTQDVIISGGIFDGNAKLDEKSTLINTVHCSNITIENCRFVHCAHWHFIEINSTRDALVRNCVFEGPSYTVISDNLYNEQIQIDWADKGAYGPVYNCEGKLIDFKIDNTVCCNIVVQNNIFKCAGFPGVGHHGDCSHHNIKVVGNIFDGPSGREGKSRGYIFFRPMVYDIEVKGNVFLAPAETESPSYGIISESSKTGALISEGNLFVGKFDKEVITGGSEFEINS